MQTMYRNGHVGTIERNALAAAARIQELEQHTQRLQADNTELNRRLSLQNRPGKQLGGVIEVASMILSEHLAGQSTGRRAMRTKYPAIGRRRHAWGIALLRLAGIVIDVNEWGAVFNEKLSINRAWQQLTATSEGLAELPSREATERIRRYLPDWQRAHERAHKRAR